MATIRTKGQRSSMCVKINGEMHYLWRALDQEGELLEIRVMTKRDKSAASAFIDRPGEFK